MAKRINKFSTENETPENQRKLGPKKYTTHDMIQFIPKTESQKIFWEEWKNGVDLIF